MNFQVITIKKNFCLNFVFLIHALFTLQEDPRKVADIISPFTNDQCVIQTLHSPHDTNQLQLTSQQNQTQSQPTHHSQHQNVRDMDIIHVSISTIWI